MTAWDYIHAIYSILVSFMSLYIHGYVLYTLKFVRIKINVVCKRVEDDVKLVDGL